MACLACNERSFVMSLSLNNIFPSLGVRLGLLFENGSLRGHRWSSIAAGSSLPRNWAHNLFSLFGLTPWLMVT